MNGQSKLVGSVAFIIWMAVAKLLTGQSPPPTSATQSVDHVSLELYRQYIAPIGKIESDTVQAAIKLVAVRSGSVPEFRELLRKDFATSRQEDGQGYDSRKLLCLITAVLGREGGQRWQHEEVQRSGFTAQRVLPVADHLYQDSPLLADVIRDGRQCNRSEIDDFAFAVRQAHHPQGKQFLLNILQNSRDRGDQDHTAGIHGPWPDSQGGAWEEARFHAAVGLAELGAHEGVQWLIEHARPNDFGIDGNVDRHQHARITSSSLRANCNAVLQDLSGLQTHGDGSQPDWDRWWQENAASFIPRPIALKP